MPVDDASAITLLETLGAQALPLFWLLLGAMLCFAALAWRLDRRYLIPRETSRLPPGWYFLLRMAIGFALIVAAAAVFAELAEVLDNAHWASRYDQVFSSAIGKNISARTYLVFSWLTRLGDTATLTALCVVVAVLLMLQRQPWLALVWTLAIAGNALLNTTLKAIFERARPLHEATVVYAQGWSFPSGHSSGATVAYGMLAYVAVRTLPAAWHLPAVLAATALVFTVGCSRVFLQVHFASDVAAGFASGTAWLTVCIVSVELARHYRRPAGSTP